MVEAVYTRNEKGKEEYQGTRIMIGGKEMKLQFTMPIWDRIDEEVCLVDDIYEMMHSKGRFKRNKIPMLVEIMSNGEITADEFMKDLDPATMRATFDAIQMTIGKAMTMKEKRYDDGSVHDETLEEIEKKDKRAD